jgi:hypothetical protein
MRGAVLGIPLDNSVRPSSLYKTHILQTHPLPMFSSRPSALLFLLSHPFPPFRISPSIAVTHLVLSSLVSIDEGNGTSFPWRGTLSLAFYPFKLFDDGDRSPFPWCATLLICTTKG